jgi:lipopolysaccharide biosynthesis glycosyltransferase/predicted O-methyltransferase YrrM
VAPNVIPTTTTNDPRYLFTPTQDWFSFNMSRWRELFPLVTASSPRVLEIGSWEGRSAVFLLTELCAQSGSIVCIDHFDLLNTPAGIERRRKILHNLALTGRPFRVVEAFSVPGLMGVLQEEIHSEEPGFDWVYIDGSHEADDTFLDGELAWRLARRGAILIFDDYRWNTQPEDSIHHPKRGIDAFMTLHSGEFDVLSSSTEYQMILRKTSDMRIGFLVKEPADVAPGAAGPLYHEMYIVLTIDASYAMAAAVTIQSVLQYTKGRVTFYIVDLGLSATDRQRLQHITDSSTEVTMVFLPLPEGAPLREMGATWAKISMIDSLPVERVLYLDADTLVRADLHPLWNTDLGKQMIGAVSDVGHPMGHAGIAKGTYFNAGVLLMDLSKVRAILPRLFEVCMQYKESLHKDQDALNAVFRDDWFSLDLKWNAQGLGTYADHPSAERDALDLASMLDAAIVHFTGSVHPGMAEVLNPYVQPFTAKPWGYAGAPGHPFADEWWSVAETTDWKGWRASDEFTEYCRIHRDEAMKAGIAAFKQKVRL